MGEEHNFKAGRQFFRNFLHLFATYQPVPFETVLGDSHREHAFSAYALQGRHRRNKWRATHPIFIKVRRIETERNQDQTGIQATRGCRGLQKSTADAWKSRGSAGVPGADGLKDDKDEGSASSNKNAKRREARKKAKAAEESGEKSKEGTNSEKKDEKPEEPIDPEAEKEKKARNLKKKLKQAKELKEKKEGGGALLPEQLAKVIKINELIRELDALGFDAEGEPKAKPEEKKEED